MKKLFVLALAALFSFNAFAQESDAVYTSEDGVVTFDVIEHWGYGYHVLKTDAFDASDAGEFFLNVLNLQLQPTSYLSLELGADLRFDHFVSKVDGFELDSNKDVQVFKLADKFGNDIKKARGWMRVGSFSFPALIKVGGEGFKLGAGAEAVVNFSGKANYKYKLDGERHKNKAKGMAMNKFYYDFVGVVCINDWSIYAKYYPKSSTFLPDGSSVKMDYWTIGVGMDF